MGEKSKATYLLLFLSFFLDLFFRKNLRLRIYFFFLSFFFWMTSGQQLWGAFTTTVQEERLLPVRSK